MGHSFKINYLNYDSTNKIKFKKKKKKKEERRRREREREREREKGLLANQVVVCHSLMCN